MTRREQYVIGFLGLAIVVGATALLWTHRAGSSPSPLKVETKPIPAAPDPAAATAAPALAPAAAPSAREVVVSVQGAVVLPGVYRLDDGSRVTDLIKAAGGLVRADVSEINLAARLLDGTTLTVPRRVDDTADPSVGPAPAVANPAAYTVSGQGAAPGGPQTKTAGSARINLNQATQSELESLPGIGPKLAQQIIEYRTTRPFGAVSDLMDVPGIGPQRFDAIRELIIVQ